jgi:DNA-binding ferritin-like protein
MATTADATEKRVNAPEIDIGIDAQLLTERMQVHEKTVWMLRSLLK